MSKIAFLHHTFYAGSGIDSVIYELAKRLGMRHKVWVITMRTDGRYPGVGVIHIKSPFRSRTLDATLLPFTKTTAEVRDALRGFDIVNTQLYPAHLMPLLPTKLPVKHVVTEWGVQSVGGGIGERAYSVMLGLAEDYAVRRADLVLAGCQCVGRQLLKKRKNGVQVLYQYGIPFDLLNEDNAKAGRTAILERYPKLKDGRLLLFVGRNSPHKGIHILIEALAMLPKDVRLAVVGRQDFAKYQRKLEKLVEKRGLKERVTFAGVVPRQEIPGWYSLCGIFVNASAWEGFLIPEAYALKKPIVAFNAEPHRETVQDGRTGLLVPDQRPVSFAVAIDRLLGQDALRTVMGENGYAWAKENLDYDRIVERWEQVVLSNEGA